MTRTRQAADLKPCPFCGAQPDTYETPAYDPDESWVGCENDDCPVNPIAYANVLSESIKGWETRVGDE